jgi:hypothetical protein
MLYSMRITIRITSDFSLEIMKVRRQWNSIFHVLKGEKPIFCGGGCLKKKAKN